MYNVRAINESIATRTVELENELTGTLDLCFDDSAVVSDNNFEFMEIGKAYECKIKLFGEFVNQEGECVVKTLIVNENICIGNINFVEVAVNSDIYYIPQSKMMSISGKDDLLFKVSRKDLIQVNSTIHEDLF